MLSLSVSPLSVCFVVVFLALLVWLFLLVCWLTACYTPVAHFGELISSLGESWLEESTAYLVPQVVSLSGLFLFKNFHTCTFLDIACRSYVWEDKYPNQLAQTTKRIYLASSIAQSPNGISVTPYRKVATSLRLGKLCTCLVVVSNVLKLQVVAVTSWLPKSWVCNIMNFWGTTSNHKQWLSESYCHLIYKYRQYVSINQSASTSLPSTRDLNSTSTLVIFL